VRIQHFILLGLALLASPAAAQQPPAAVSAEQEMAANGVWLERANAAMIAALDGFQKFAVEMKTLSGPGLNKAKASAAAPALRQLISQARADVRRSDGLLAAMPAFPSKQALPFSPDQIIADGRAQNARFLVLLDANEVFITAMAKGDVAAMGRVLPQILDGTFAVMGHQRLILRNRQATIPPSESSYQSIGIAIELYRAMELVGRGALGARSGAVGAAKAAAALGPELGKVGRTTRGLTAAGRKTLAAELVEVKAALAGPNSDSDKRVLDRVARVIAEEEKLFDLGDRLAGLMESNAAIGGPELAATGMPKVYADLIDLEAGVVAINTAQAGILAEPAR
jgi:hypothetical protein